MDALRQGLRELGYIEGQHIAFEFRFAAGQDERLRELALELKQRKMDVLVVAGGAAAAIAKETSEATPIVFVRVGDPVGTGLVDSLATPGGNLTGLTSFSPQLIGKRLEILKEIVPNASNAIMLWDVDHPNESEKAASKVAALRLGMKLISLQVPGSADVESAFKEARDQKADALITLVEDVSFNQRRRILGFANQGKLPALYPIREFVDDGGLLSYGPSVTQQFRRAAVYVDKILKGAKPAELPVEQPTRFEMVIGLKAAQTLDLRIPESVLLQADEVIR
ncbi:MAG TPA: ABC transporter substrate-binding protein [Chloroflexota bacterium]|nr:ABC transporter substrate-binding protein [Chloroflexota bacterium]